MVANQSTSFFAAQRSAAACCILIMTFEFDFQHHFQGIMLTAWQR